VPVSEPASELPPLESAADVCPAVVSAAPVLAPLLVPPLVELPVDPPVEATGSVVTGSEPQVPAVQPLVVAATELVGVGSPLLSGPDMEVEAVVAAPVAAVLLPPSSAQAAGRARHASARSAFGGICIGHS